MITIERHATYTGVVLDAGRGNALGPALLAELGEALTAAAQEAPALMLAARGRSFCTGLDLAHARRCDRAAMAELMRAFHDTLSALLFFPGPTVAAIGGNALAGGALLALACDARFVALGAGRIGIHGARLGIAYPDVAIEIARLRLPRPQLESMLYGGATFAAEAAPEIGFAQQVVDAEQLTSTCVEWIKAQGSSGAVAANKAQLLSAARARLTPMGQVGAARFLDIWFSPTTQRAVDAALAELSAPGSGNSDAI